ncbi:molybdopterin-guanine dinucleotide biosynthesis protein [Cryobacterium lactosi]|uniref:Molybdopterin-guanine dinucleotide biosynthesis protein n=1 Tax=Cryobacterium lactosi TaxID=1259202 RepID=A0A4R9BXJ4_9MICO|nr:NTP transferase domain-containing protein [Cryobacterium lactosi]TFD92699.1 molybdopterin-guanine dinucleotide biosynthesis protein [Cryobacterium lactosi]
MPRHESSPPPATAAGPRWSAIIVAGGRATRLGGIDKTALVWQGHSLLDGVVAAASGAARICVVGSDADLGGDLLRAVERPRWGGPAAAIVAGLEAVAGDADTDWVLVLAGDLVHADAAVTLLLAELDRINASEMTATTSSAPAADRPIDGLIGVDSDGRRQPLLAVYRRAALLASARLHPADNLPVKSLIGSLNLVQLRLPDALTDDVDTPADAARLGIVVPAPAAPSSTPRPTR